MKSSILSFFDRSAYGECIICSKRVKKNVLAACCDNAGICRKCFDKLPFIPVGKTFPGNKAIEYYMAVFYYKGDVPSVVSDYKFRGCLKNGEVFARLMCDLLAVYEENYDFDLIVPVPLSKEHLKMRGYNQAAVLAEYIAKEINVDYTECALLKTRNTQKQTELSPLERSKNVIGAFWADKKYVEGRHILLIDDVVTTGSTVKACAGALIESGALSVKVFSFARKYSSDKSKAYKELFNQK